MPRYFFHVFNDCEFVADKEGCEFSGLEEAKLELKSLAVMLPDKMQHPGVRICVVDENGRTLAEHWLSRTHKF